MTTLPAIRGATLPETYLNAKTALAECSRIDECKDWADKAAALASYAKQAKDETMRKMADRIQARAIRRCGELLKQVDRGKTGPRVEGRHRPVTRTDAAESAGLSERQRKTALRVASVPAEEFEQEVEGEDPPTITALASRGTVHKEQNNPAFPQATQALGTLRELARFCKDNDPKTVAHAVMGHEATKARQHVKIIDGWLDVFVTHIGEQ